MLETDPLTIQECLVPLREVKLLVREESAEQQDSCDPDFQERQTFVLRDPLHEFRLFVQRPISCPAKVPFVLLWKVAAELDHAFHNPRRMAHDRVSTLSMRAV